MLSPAPGAAAFWCRVPGVVAEDSRANEDLYRATGEVGLPSLEVPGQARRGNKRDPGVLVCLAEHPALASALERLEASRPSASAGSEALVELSSNPSSHLRAILSRLARLAEVDWRPSRGSTPSALDVARMRSVLDAGVDWTGQRRRRRDVVMVLVGFLCAMRRSELCALRIRDVRVVAGEARVRIVKSKTDQDQRGTTVVVHRSVDAPPSRDAVARLVEWVAEMKSLGAGPDDCLFPSLDPHGRPRRSAGGAFEAMGDQAWSDELRSLAAAARVFGDDDTGRYEMVAGHSLRRGFVTTALLAGHDPVTVAKRTRHKDIKMIATYADELALMSATNWTAALLGPDMVGALGDLG